MTRLIKILFFISQYLLGQFPSYDLSEVTGNNFVAAVEPLVRSTSFSLGYHQFSEPDLSSRFSVNVNAAVGTENSFFGLPIIHGALLLTDNLIINGIIGGVTSDNDVLQYSGYGFSLSLSEDDTSQWVADLSLAKMDGPRHLHCRTIDASISKASTFKAFPFFFGFGINQYTSRIFYQSDGEIPENISGSANYMLLGKIISFSNWSVETQARINNKITQFSLSLHKSFN
ncbi:MAG: hypothetical protein VX284_02090 [Candidatus Neomarinimicrobiota bacterium]|nr:hypothetical protein [Candidatus Neomarinimicrobiota bacterium]